jgi:Protein of unknown function (DUF3830)
MARYIEVILEKRNVRCVARLLDKEAPRTAEAVWQALPQAGDLYHAKYANHEIYTLVPTFAEREPGLEYSTVTPIPGDLVYFHISRGTWVPKEASEADSGAMIDLAVFYDRNNLLLSPAEGFFPGNVFGTIVENLEAMKEAGYRIWREGAIGERLIFRRLEDEKSYAYSKLVD